MQVGMGLDQYPSSPQVSLLSPFNLYPSLHENEAVDPTEVSESENETNLAQVWEETLQVVSKKIKSLLSSLHDDA